MKVYNIKNLYYADPLDFIEKEFHIDRQQLLTVEVANLENVVNDAKSLLFIAKTHIFFASGESVWLIKHTEYQVSMIGEPPTFTALALFFESFSNSCLYHSLIRKRNNEAVPKVFLELPNNMSLTLIIRNGQVCGYSYQMWALSTILSRLQNRQPVTKDLLNVLQNSILPYDENMFRKFLYSFVLYILVFGFLVWFSQNLLSWVVSFLFVGYLMLIIRQLYPLFQKNLEYFEEVYRKYGGTV